MQVQQKSKHECILQGAVIELSGQHFFDIIAMEAFLQRHSLAPAFR